MPVLHPVGGHSVNFKAVNAKALTFLPFLVRQWLPDGARRGREWIAKNPTRADRRAGSFSVNLDNGRWADFATGDKGGDIVSLAAYIFRLNQAEAARTLAVVFGVERRP